MIGCNGIICQSTNDVYSEPQNKTFQQTQSRRLRGRSVLPYLRFKLLQIAGSFTSCTCVSLGSSPRKPLQWSKLDHASNVAHSVHSTKTSQLNPVVFAVNQLGRFTPELKATLSTARQLSRHCSGCPQQPLLSNGLNPRCSKGRGSSAEEFHYGAGAAESQRAQLLPLNVFFPQTTSGSLNTTKCTKGARAKCHVESFIRLLCGELWKPCVKEIVCISSYAKRDNNRVMQLYTS